MSSAPLSLALVLPCCHAVTSSSMFQNALRRLQYWAHGDHDSDNSRDGHLLLQLSVVQAFSSLCFAIVYIASYLRFAEHLSWHMH